MFKSFEKRGIFSLNNLIVFLIECMQHSMTVNSIHEHPFVGTSQDCF